MTAISGEQRDSVQEETLAVSATHNRPLLLQKRGHIQTEENPRQVLVPQERVLLERKAEKRAKTFSEEIVRNRHVISGIIPCVKITNLYRDANSATDVCSEALRMASPVKSQRKVVGKDQLLF